MATSSCANCRCASRPTYDTSSDAPLANPRVTERSSRCEYGVLIAESSPQLIAKLPFPVAAGTAGNPPAGAVGSSDCGTAVIPVNRGAVSIGTDPGAFDRCDESPYDPVVSKFCTVAAPKWSNTSEYPARMLVCWFPNSFLITPSCGAGEYASAS